MLNFGGSVTFQSWRWPLLAIVVLYTIVLHLWVNARQPDPYMDELFHVPQAQRFCHFARHRSSLHYDASITTPPGLYLMPCILSMVHPVFCSIRFLRALSGLCVVLCIPQAAAVLSSLRGRMNLTCRCCDSRTCPAVVAEATAVILHPVFFFYSILFYTDPPAVLCLLICARLSLIGRHYYSAFAGCFASMCRQTSSVLHAYIAFDALVCHFQRGGLIKDLGTICVPHSIAGCLYLALFYLNDFSVAIGDRENHPFGLHYAMLPYFAANCGLFLALLTVSRFVFANGCSSEVKQLWKIVRRSRGTKIMFLLCLVISALLVIATGSTVHPFSVSDNRHYIFYLYRRVLLRSPWVRLGLIPLYAICLAIPFIHILISYEALLIRPQSKTQTPWSQKKARSWLRLELMREISLLCAISVCVLPATLFEPRYFAPGTILVSLRHLSRQRTRSDSNCATVVILLLVNTAFVFVFCELPFQRPLDKHMPSDASPGRFMF